MVIETKNSRKKIIVPINIIILSLLLSYQIQFGQNTENILNLRQSNQNQAIDEKRNLQLVSSTRTNYEIIQELFSQKTLDYTSLGYFPQVYTPSLQACYYALYILDSLGKLDQINQTKITNYIMSYYNDNSHIFMDVYSYRYLESDYLEMVYPLSSMLQIHCYALLSLELLGSLDVINPQDSIDFIWSCLNPEGDFNGFIGCPYTINLPNHFKLSTMDNTYWAIETLDILIDNWEGYSSEKSRIVQYINSLQCIHPGSSAYGGFFNDNYTFYISTLKLPEPNLLSCYFCIKSLDTLNFLHTVRIEEFHSFLDNLYNKTGNYFRIFNGLDDLNIVASALGLELSDITGYTNISRNDVIQFLLDNRNELGNWDRSTTYQYHELVDTFRIIKCLKESGEIDQFSEQEKNEIAESLNLYTQFKGYSLISKDYTSLELLNSIINAFQIYDKIPELDILAIYKQIEDCLVYDFLHESYSFLNCFASFKSNPIEYINLGHHDGKFMTSHEVTFLALDALNKIYKLDDFALKYDLSSILNDILDSQFLFPEYEGYGAFLPGLSATLTDADIQNKKVYLKYSFFAIKTMELISDFLKLGGLNNLSINKGALFTYILGNFIETDTLLYFNSKNSSDTELLLQNTFYAIYILNSLNLLSLNSQKIKNFVIENLDYHNIKNIYYSYKISEIFDLDIEFDHILTQSLVKALYSEDLREFFLSTEFEMIDQEIFHWICELAKNDQLKIDCTYIDFILLGSINTITTSFNNIILDDFGPGIAVQFESEQLGLLNLEKQLDVYQINFLVPESPDFFPKIEGLLNIYDYAQLIGQKQIKIETILDLIVNHKIIKNKNTIHFEINISRSLSSGSQPVYNSNLCALVFIEDIYIQTLSFNREDFIDYSRFTLSYEFQEGKDIFFNITLYDDFFTEGCSIITFLQTSKQSDTLNFGGWGLALIGLASTATTVVITKVIGKKIKNRRNNAINKKGKSKPYQEITNLPANEVLDKIKESAFEDYN
ncbi:MAG: hypothetical protein ACFFAF_03310 [Candidatus Hermodarchaeota archaeon]